MRAHHPAHLLNVGTQRLGEWPRRHANHGVWHVEALGQNTARDQSMDQAVRSTELRDLRGALLVRFVEITDLLEVESGSGEGGAEQSMGIINSVGGSQSDVAGKDVAPPESSNVQTAEEVAREEQRAQEAKADKKKRAPREKATTVADTTTIPSALNHGARLLTRMRAERFTFRGDRAVSLLGIDPRMLSQEAGLPPDLNP